MRMRMRVRVCVRILCELANLRMMANSNGRCRNLTRTLSGLKRAEPSPQDDWIRPRGICIGKADGSRPRQLGDASFARPLGPQGKGALPMAIVIFPSRC